LGAEKHNRELPSVPAVEKSADLAVCQLQSVQESYKLTQLLAAETAKSIRFLNNLKLENPGYNPKQVKPSRYFHHLVIFQSSLPCFADNPWLPEYPHSTRQ
jgi:hypothetical protein